MRILHVVNRMDPSDGGPPTVVAHLAGAQALCGHSVTVAALEPRTCDDVNTLHDTVPGYRGVSLRFFATRPLLERLTARRAARVLSRDVREADFVHVHGLWQPLLFRAARASAGAGVPYAVTPHGMLSHWAMTRRAFRKRIALTVGWREVFARAALVQFLNTLEQADAGRHVDVRNGIVVPNGVSIADLRAPTSVDPSFAAALPDDFVLFLARLHDSKGVALLPAAFDLIAARYPRLHLLIAGPDFGARHAVEEAIRRSPAGSRIRLLGGVYGDEKRLLLQRARCLCHPTMQEGFSMTILEALAGGVPVVTTVHANFPDLAARDAGLLVEPRPAAIAVALARILDDDSTFRRMSANASRLAEQYDWRDVASALLSHYAAHAGVPSWAPAR